MMFPPALSFQMWSEGRSALFQYLCCLTNRTEIGSEVVVESLITINDRMDILALLSRFGTDVIPVVGERGVISFVTSDSNTEAMLEKLLGSNVLTVRKAIHAGKRISVE